MPHGRSPTLIWAITDRVRGSTTLTAAPRPSETYTRLPSGETATPSGFVWPLPMGIVASTRFARVSTIESVPPISALTYALRPSGEKATQRGRAPTSMRPRTLPERASSTVTSSVDSPVAYTLLPSGVTATPSGSVPTGATNSVRPDATSTAVTVDVASFVADEDRIGSRRQSGKPDEAGEACAAHRAADARAVRYLKAESSDGGRAASSRASSMRA